MNNDNNFRQKKKKEKNLLGGSNKWLVISSTMNSSRRMDGCEHMPRMILSTDPMLWIGDGSISSFRNSVSKNPSGQYPSTRYISHSQLSIAIDRFWPFWTKKLENFDLFLLKNWKFWPGKRKIQILTNFGIQKPKLWQILTFFYFITGQFLPENSKN